MTYMSENCCSQCDTKQTSCDDWIAEKNMTAQQRASIHCEKPNNWSLVSTSCWYHYQIMCLPPSFRFQKIQDTINSTIDDRRILMQKTSHPATSVFFFSATSKLSHSLGVGPVRRYDSLHVEGETRNHGNRSVMSSSAHSCVRTCRNQRLLPTLLFTYLYLILVVAITVSETEFTVKNARLQLTKNKMALGWSMNS